MTIKILPNRNRIKFVRFIRQSDCSLPEKEVQVIVRRRLFRDTTEGVDDLLSVRARRASLCSFPDRVGQPNQRPSLHPFILFRIDSISPVGRKPSQDRESNEDRRGRGYSRVRRYKWRFMLAELTRRNLAGGGREGGKRDEIEVDQGWGSRTCRGKRQWPSLKDLGSIIFRLASFQAILVVIADTRRVRLASTNLLSFSGDYILPLDRTSYTSRGEER